MKIDDVRRLALSLPETAEQSHMAHPDFRVCGTTNVLIRAAHTATLREVLGDAWRNAAPKSLARQLDDPPAWRVPAMRPTVGPPRG